MRENAIFNVLYGEIFPHVNKLRLRTKSLNGTLLLLAHYLCIHFTEPCDKLKAIPFFIIFLHTPSPFMSRMKLLTSKRAIPKPVFLKVNTVWRNLCAWRASGYGFRYMTINGKCNNENTTKILRTRNSMQQDVIIYQQTGSHNTPTLPKWVNISWSIMTNVLGIFFSFSNRR